MSTDGWELPPGLCTSATPVVRGGAAADAGLAVCAKQVVDAEPVIAVVQG